MFGSDIKIVESEKELNDAHAVRKKVFQEEQGVAPDADFDQQDSQADHVIVYIDEHPIGTARIRYLDLNRQSAKIERVAVLKEYRKLGIGRLIMEFVHDYLEQNGVKEAELESQEHAKGFYEKLGYKQEGETFEEVGIPHVKMGKKFSKKEEQNEKYRNYE